MLLKYLTLFILSFLIKKKKFRSEGISFNLLQNISGEAKMMIY